MAAALPEGTVEVGRPVTDVRDLAARTVVVATDPVTAARFTGLAEPSLHALTTFYHLASEPPSDEPALHIHGDAATRS